MNYRTRQVCPVCGEDKIETTLKIPFDDDRVWSFIHEYYKGRPSKDQLQGGNYAIGRCEGCGMVFQQEVLNDELLKELYEVWISAEESLAKKQATKGSLFDQHASQARAIRQLVGRRPSEISVFEFGMGWGYWLLMARAFGYQVAGAELSEPRVEFCKSNGLKVIEDIFAHGEESFDYIFSNQVFEHLTEPYEILEQLVRLLKPGGFIHISVPQGIQVGKRITEATWKPAKNALHPLEHVNCFTRKHLVLMGRRAGLTPHLRPVSSVATGPLSWAKNLRADLYDWTFSTNVTFRKPGQAS